jgi:hypothetical protein
MFFMVARAGCGYPTWRRRIMMCEDRYDVEIEAHYIDRIMPAKNTQE